MRIPRYVRAAAAHQEIQVRALVRLLHPLHVQPVPAPLRQRGRIPPRATARQLLVTDVQVQAAHGHVHLDHIARFHQRQRAASRRLG